jgi:succinyl-diaminopimelate desuccinylase
MHNTPQNLQNKAQKNPQYLTSLDKDVVALDQDLCFAGHVDVVPTGPEQEWDHPPFDAIIDKGMLFGRGIANMKGGIAWFLSAILIFCPHPIPLSRSLVAPNNKSFILNKNLDQRDQKITTYKNVLSTTQPEMSQNAMIPHQENPRYLTSLDKDVVALAQDFIRYPSVTPRDFGLLTHLSQLLSDKGWVCHVVMYGEVTNLYARLGTQGRHLCFAGHVDVVPTGPEQEWDHPPFDAIIDKGVLFGRGIADMKGGITCFLSAILEFPLPKDCSVSLLLTSDEEGDALDGTKRMVAWMAERNQRPDVFLIGEPTGNVVGSVIQTGRRGSITGTLTVKGKQGHIAYPEAFDNPVSKIIRTTHALMDMPLDQNKDPHFEPSRLEITSIDTGNPATNVIWGQSSARFGVRFNGQHTASQLVEKMTQVCRHVGGADPRLHISGESFLSTDPKWIACVQAALKKATQSDPKQTTKGGITDGRFLIAIAPVLEVGLPEDTMHQINERVAVADLYLLKECYMNILQGFFSQDSLTTK